jgi:GDPmannose 4,6-dehydratase
VKRALIIGSQGQDGRYLRQCLASQNYLVTGIDRGAVEGESLAGLAAADIADARQVRDLVAAVSPDEIYHLAAHHHSSESAPLGAAAVLRTSIEINAYSLIYVLEALNSLGLSSRVFYAASSRIFGIAEESPQTEATPIRPICAYGISKALGLHACRLFRSDCGLFASVGILFNHESPLRGPQFVTRKIVNAAVRICRGSSEKLVVGDLSAQVDWGWAPDYVRAMWLILQSDSADEFVIGTGELHSVGEFAAAAFGSLGLDWRQHVVEQPNLLLRPNLPLRADISKIRRITGWQPETKFQDLVRFMVDAEVRNANADIHTHIQ